MITESFFQAFLYRLLTTVFYQIMAYFPFRRHLRFSPGWVLVFSGSAQAVLAAVYACATMHGAPVTATTLFSVLASFAVFGANVRADRRKILFLYIFVLDYVLLVQGLAYFTEALLFYSPSMTFGSVHTLVLILAYSSVTAPFALFFLEKSSAWTFQTDAPSFWNVAWLLPAFTTLIVTMYTCGGTLSEILDIRFLVGRVLLIFVQFLVYYILLQALHLLQKQELLKEQKAMQDALLAVSRTQYRQLCRHMREVRQARHDLKQHLRLIQHYLDTGKKEDLKDYLKRYAQSLPKEDGDLYCDNYAVNTIIAYYGMAAKNARVAFYANVSLPEPLPLPEPEICSMLGNLLENALEGAQEKNSGVSPFIRVQGELNEGQILIAIDNSCTAEPAKKGRRLLSSKHEGFGTGTASVRATAEKYQGGASFRYENQVFYASVFLQMPMEKIGSDEK